MIRSEQEKRKSFIVDNQKSSQFGCSSQLGMAIRSTMRKTIVAQIVFFKLDLRDQTRKYIVANQKYG